MLGKILLTLLVITAALSYLRAQRSSIPKVEARRSARWLAIGLVLIMVGGAASYFYWRWQQDHQILILQVRQEDGNTIQYQVYRKDFYSMTHFKTIEGLEIKTAQNQQVELRTQ